MMAPDSRSTPEPRLLADDTMAVLRAAVVQLWHQPRGAEDALREALALVTAEARSRALRAEDVIVAFKSLLASLPELHSGPRRMEAVAFQERLVTMCIKAYYHIADTGPATS